MSSVDKRTVCTAHEQRTGAWECAHVWVSYIVKHHCIESRLLYQRCKLFRLKIRARIQACSNSRFKVKYAKAIPTCVSRHTTSLLPINLLSKSTTTRFLLNFHLLILCAMLHQIANGLSSIPPSISRWFCFQHEPIYRIHHSFRTERGHRRDLWQNRALVD